MPVPWRITIDCDRPGQVAAFWAVALGYVEPEPPSGYETWAAWLAAQGVPEDEWDDSAYLAAPDGSAPSISFLKVPEPKRVKNRMHLDVDASGGRDAPQAARELAIRSTVGRLVEAGGRVLGEHPVAGPLDHVVMADPEGNEFCVV